MFFGIWFALLPCMKWKALLFVSLFLFSFTAFAEETQPFADPGCDSDKVEIYLNPDTNLYYVDKADAKKNKQEGKSVKVICASKIEVANGNLNGSDQFHPENGVLCRSKCAPGQIVIGLSLITDEHDMLVQAMRVICALPNLVDEWKEIQSTGGCGLSEHPPDRGVSPPMKGYRKTCDKGSYLKGAKAWIGSTLDGLQLECAPINYNATTAQDLFSNDGVLQDPTYGLNERYRKDNGFPGIPAFNQTDFCDKGFFPVEIDMWWKDFCWTPDTWDWDDEICYYNKASGIRAVCGEASLGTEIPTHEIKIDPAGIPYGTSFPNNPEGRGERCEQQCNAGDIIVGLNVQTGSLVDKIGVLCSNPNQWLVYPVTSPEGCGGSGGNPHPMRCGMWEYVRSWKMRIGNAADSIQIECASLNTYASTIDEALNGPGWWSWEVGINPSNSSSTREDRGYPDAPPLPDPKKLCPEAGTLPSGLDVWHKKFCWANGRACYDDVVSGARAYCKKASLGAATQIATIDPSRLFHWNDEVQVEFVGSFAEGLQNNSETSTEDTPEDAPENSETPPAGEQCDGQCSNYPACPSGQTMNICCACVDPATTPPNNGSNNGGGNAGGGSNPSSDPANPDPGENSIANSTPSGSSGGGCSLNNNASFDPFLAALFPIALLLLILRRRRLVRH